MLLKPRLRRSDVPLHSSFANGFAILMQTNRYAARRLAKCYIFSGSTVRSVLMILGLSISSIAYGCGDINIPIRTTGILDGEDWGPNENEPGTLIIAAPKDFHGYSLLDAHLLFGENSVSIAMADLDGQPNTGAFYVNGDLDLFRKSHVVVQYRVPPHIDEAGNKSWAMCKYSQIVHWKI